MSVSLLSQAFSASEGGGEFEAPSVEYSFFFDRIGDGTVIASVKAMVLLVLGTLLIMAFFLAVSRKAAMIPSKWQFAGESAYGFVRNGVAIEILGGHHGRKWAGFLTTLFVFILVQNLWGIIPLAQLPVTSHFAIPVLLAVMVWFIYMTVGIQKHGFFGFFKLHVLHPGHSDRHALPADPDRIPVEHHPAAVHAGHPVVRQHVRRPHADHHRGGRHACTCGVRAAS